MIEFGRRNAEVGKNTNDHRIIYRLWERFLTAIIHVIVAGGHSHKPLASI